MSSEDQAENRILRRTTRRKFLGVGIGAALVGIGVATRIRITDSSGKRDFEPGKPEIPEIDIPRSISEGGIETAELKEANKTPEIDPHSLRALYDNSTGTTFVIDPEKTAIRIVEAPPVIQRSLVQRQGFEAEVIWKSVVGGKVGAPWIAVLKTRDGETMQRELEYTQGVKVKGRGVESQQTEIDPRTLRAFYDEMSDTTFLVTPEDTVVRTIPIPEGVIRNALHGRQGFDAEVIWKSVAGGKLGAPYLLVLTTRDGSRIESDVEHAQGNVIIKPKEANP